MILMEIYSKPTAYNHEIGRCKDSYGLREVYLNPSHIVSMRHNEELNSKSKSVVLLEGLDKNVIFSQITISSTLGTEFVNVVGSPRSLANKIAKASL
jgi:hypothetical protein